MRVSLRKTPLGPQLYVGNVMLFVKRGVVPFWVLRPHGSTPRLYIRGFGWQVVVDLTLGRSWRRVSLWRHIKTGPHLGRWEVVWPKRRGDEA